MILLQTQFLQIINVVKIQQNFGCPKILILL